MKQVEVIIVGGGASGMVAAIEAARAGKQVLLLEKKKDVGKKLLATGNGRCNFTNRVQEESCYRSEHPSLAFQAVQCFDDSAAIAWFREIGILAAEKSGYVYPASFQASSVVHALQKEMAFASVDCHKEEEVCQVVWKQGKFQVKTDKDVYQTRTLLLSTGGKASPVHGSSGDGFSFAKSFGHTVVPPLPALTSLVLEGKFMKQWAGNRLSGNIWLEEKNGKKFVEEQGEVLFTDYGISGIPVFQVSRFAARALKEQKMVWLCLDSMPGYSKEWLQEELLHRKRQYLQRMEHRHGRKPWERYSAADLLEGMLPDKFAKTLLEQSGVSPSCPVSEWRESSIRHLAHQIKEWKFSVKAVSGFEKAQVCAGGVPLTEIDIQTFASKKVKGLYFAGEILDVDGTCGGYNLQWAWTSGVTAGRAIGKLSQKG